MEYGMISVTHGELSILGVRNHVQRTIEEENGRTERARTGARLERAIAVRWKNIVLREWMQCQRTRRGGLAEREFGG